MKTLKLTTNKKIFETWVEEVETAYATSNYSLNSFGKKCAETCFNVEELLEERKRVRLAGDFRKSDEIRNILDQLLIFVFDLKNNETEVYYLTPKYFRFKNKFEETKQMTLRKYVEYKIQKDIQAEKLAEAWLFTTRASS